MKENLIGLQPSLDNKKSNPYTDRMAENLAHLGRIFPFPSVRDFSLNPFCIFRRRFDFVILNWVENSAYDQSGRSSLWRDLRIRIYFLAAKAVSRRLVWVRHNNFPHSVTLPKEMAYGNRLFRWIESLVDVVITHSPLEAGGKRKYVPHPLYAKAVGADNPLPLKDYFFIFGRISPYKNLSEIIRLAPVNLNLVIAGPANDDAYLKELELLAENKENIYLLPGFMASEVAARIAIDSLGIIVANADADMVVSGSYIYALSLGVPLYAVHTPFMGWLSGLSGLSGTYSFDSLEILLERIGCENEINSRPNPVLVEGAFGDAAVLWHLKSALGLSDEIDNNQKE